MLKLSNISTIKELMRKHDMTFSKSLGQNFLINPSVCPRMAENAVKSDDMCVLEIGPGIGVLTSELAKRAEKVVAVELDKRLLPILDETLADFNNIKIINGDILKMDLNKLFKNEFEGKEVCVCANLPYYISSPVIMKILEDKVPISSMIIMLQKEAAQRICAKPATRQVGAISIAVLYYAKPEILFNVSKGSFMPAPKVESSVVKLNIRKEQINKVQSEKTFFKLVKQSFSCRRKTLVNAISLGFNIEKSEVKKILADNKINLNARAEQLKFEQFIDLSNTLGDK